MTDDAAYSRLIASAALLGERAPDAHRFTTKKVLLTGEASTLSTANGAEIASAALRLLVRTCRNVTVALPPECGGLRTELERLGRETAITPVTFRDDIVARDFEAILSVGTQARSDLPWTVVNSNGWRARVSSTGRSLAAECSQANPIGSLGAACLGVADVFKRLIALREDKGELLDGVSFSFWTYTCDGDDPGPPLPERLTAGDLLLVGGGAIGNGIAYLLARLPIAGRAVVVDRQEYGAENWGTCICLPACGFIGPKADFIAKLLREKLDARARHMEVQALVKEFGTTLPYPTVALNGLDDIDARHEVQRLWSDLVVDGAIGSDMSCQVSCHPWGEDVACLMCVFHHPTTRSEVLASRATGLSEAIVSDGQVVVTQVDIDAAPPAKKAWLAARLGQKVCSVVSEAMALALSKENQEQGIAPSVPFVACFSGCMVVTEFVRYLSEGRVFPEPRYALNLLWGPQRGIEFSEGRRATCFCVERASSINKVRAKRRHSLEAAKPR
jgi:hypothetical protein